MGIVAWLTLHWIDLLQSLGIIGGLLFSARSVSDATKAQKVQNIFSLTAAHRDIWSLPFRYPHLARVLQPSADPKSISDDEKMFVQMLILHLRMSYKAREAGMAFSEDGLRSDIQQFFSLPIPKSVWESSKHFQDAEFLRFVSSCISA